MSISINSAYGTAVSGDAGGKLYVPVNRSVLIYSHFDHVSGFAAQRGQSGVSIAKIKILNTLIDHLSAVKAKEIPNAANSSPEQVDALIEQYQAQLHHAVKSAETLPYQLSDARMEAGTLFSISA
ncbi:MAG: hypothetical protein K2H09_02110 [Treponemataceae bacterium]|nr:hypothetical protein [Treponemataceae bacterium]